MASTWAGTADNELVSFNALRNAYDTGQLSFISAPTASNRICTKADMTTYVNIDTSTSGWSAYPTNQCLTKAILRGAAYLTMTVKGSKPSGGGNVWMLFKVFRGATTIAGPTGTQITSTTCGNASMSYNLCKYGDTLEVYCNSSSTYAQLYQFYWNLESSGTCGTGITQCGVSNVVINSNKVYVLQPRLSGGSYVIC